MVRTVLTRYRVATRLLYCSGVVAATLFVAVGSASAQSVTPDSACANESAYRSTAGDQRATLTIVNNTGETLQLFWLDYSGARVFYQPLAAHAISTQETFLTHPWIVANSAGT